ncbi:Mitotic-spindle organizing protein 1, partial [Thoreauomyces humboldtii]
QPASASTAQRAQETMDILSEMARILNTGLDRETLSLCVSLCESGVNPEALALIIKELRTEAAVAKRAQ